MERRLQSPIGWYSTDMRVPFVSALSLVLVAVACATPPPPIEHASSGGVVRAFDAEEARQLSSIATEVTVEVCRLLGVEPRSFVIHAYADDADHAGGIRVERDRHGQIIGRTIELRAGVWSAPRFLIAHEITHWSVAGSPWDRLPHAAEEGLCDFVAGQVAPKSRDERVLDLKARAARGLDAPIDDVLALTSRTWEHADAGAKTSAYALGYFLVERIGLERLRRLCESGVAQGPSDVSTEQLLEAAGLDRATLMPALRAWGAEASQQPFELRLKFAPSGG